MSELSKAEFPHLAGLLLRTTRRLWLQSVLNLLFRSAWWSGGLVFTAGLVHGLGVPLSWRYSLLLALAPAGIAAVVGLLFRRPTPEQTAAQLDKRLGSRELMVSALAQGRLPPNRRAGAARFVLRQAEQTAESAGGGREILRRNPAAMSTLIPLGLGVAGLILHLNVGLERFPPSGVSGPGTDGRTAVATVAGAPDAAIRDLKRSLVQIASSMSMEQRRPARRAGSLPSTAPSVGAVIDNAVADRRTALQPKTGSGRSRSFDGRTVSEGSDEAGSGVPGSMKAGETQSTDLSIEFTDIERRTQSGAAKEGHALSNTGQVSEFKDPSESDALAPGERVALPYQMSFGPALRGYVRAYFSQTQQDK